MKSHFSLRLLLYLTAGTLAVCSAAHSRQINWRSPIASTNVMSNDVAMDASFEFQLGAFADGFQPTAENTNEWSEQWRMLDSAAYNDSTRFFSSSILLESNELFPTGTSGYIWGRNTINGADNEWILLRSVRWRWPVANNGVAFPLEWEVDESAIAILGDVNGETFLMKTERLESGTGNTADQWRTTHFSEAQLADPQISGWDADPDKDGAHNLLEFTTGGEPLAVDSQASSPVWTRTSGGEFTFDLPVTTSARPLVEFRLQFSTSMSRWLPLPAQGTETEHGIRFSVTPGNDALYYRIALDFQ